jgi:hypothetical protein
MARTDGKGQVIQRHHSTEPLADPVELDHAGPWALRKNAVG